MRAFSFLFPFPDASARISDHDEKLRVIKDHSRLDEVLAVYARSHLEMHRKMAPIVKLFYTHAVFTLETVLWYLHDLKEVEGKGDGATLSKLQLAAFYDGFLSPRSVNNLIARLVDMGQVARVSDGRDGRVRRLVPTEAGKELSLARMLMVTDAMKVMFPESQLSHYFQTHLFYHIDLEVSRINMTSQNPFRQYREVEFFLSRTGGFSLYVALLEACLNTRGRLTDDTPVQVSYAGLSQELGVSETQLRTLVREARAAGILRAAAPNEELILLPESLIESGRGTMAHWILVMHEVEDRMRNSGLIPEGPYGAD